MRPFLEKLMTYPCQYRFGLAVFFSLAFAFPSPAQNDAWPVPRGPSREPVPYRYDAKIWSKVPRAFLDDSAACILYYGTNHHIEADGTVETVTHEITRLGGRKGIESLGEYRAISYDPTWQTLVLNEARIHKADGQIVPIEPRHVHLRDVSTDYQVYDRDKQLVISFPNIAVGDCYEVKWTSRGKNPEFGGRFFTRVTFGDDQYPVVRDELRVRLPKAMPLKHAAINGKVPLNVTHENNHRLYHWHVNQRKPLPQDADRPSRETQRLQVLLSTFTSWDEVGQWKEKVRAKCWESTPEIRALVKTLTRDLKTPLEKARALTYWVRRSIRYVSISSSGRGYTPRLPQQVFLSRYGDCKDQNQLLAVMMKEAGVNVELVTLGILDDGQVEPEVPSPWGTHGILLATIAGKEHWIDTTVPLAGWDYLPRSDRDRVVYVTDGGKVRLLKTPPLTYADNRIVQLTELTVQPDGTTVGRRAMTHFGLSALSRRDAWMETPPGERRRLLTAELQDAHSRARLLEFVVDDRELAKLDQPVTARLDYHIAQHFGGDSASREASLTDSNVWNRLLAYNLDPDRPVPLHLWTPFESVHRYLVQLPLAYRFDGLPRSQKVPSPWGFFEVRVQADDFNPRRLEVTFHTRLEKALVEPADFAAFQKFHDAVSKHWRVWLTIKPTTDLLDARALEILQAFTLGADNISAAILAKLYQHESMVTKSPFIRHDRNADARRVLQRALVLHPEDVTLWDLLVKSAADLGEEEAVYAEMIQRFPKDKKYVLALGATRVKRGDQVGAGKVLLPLTTKETGEIRAKAHFHLAQSALEQNHARLALEHLEAAKAADAETVASGPALRFKAQVHEQLGQRDEALAAYRDALKTDTDVDDVLAALARLELAAGRTSDALDAIRRLAVRAGNDRPALLRAGELYLQAGRYDDALDLAHRARELGFSSQTQRLLGLAYFHQGHYDKAVFHLERAEPSAEVVEHLIRGYLAQGKLLEAQRHAEAVHGITKSTLGLSQAETLVRHLAEQRAFILGETQVAAKQKATAARAVEAYLCAAQAYRQGRPKAHVEKLLAIALQDGLPLGPAYALRGLLAVDQGKLRQAMADAERATTLSPNLADGFYLRGRIRLERGDLGALGDLLRAAALSQRKDGLILHWLAAAQWQIGQHSQAVQTQRLAAGLCPRNEEVVQQCREFEKMATEIPE